MTTLVGSGKGTTSATSSGTPAIGDLMLACATRNASATKPTVPAGLTAIGSGSTVNTNSIVGAFKYLTTASGATGTFTNATETVVHIYRPTAGNAGGIGAFAFAGGSSATASYTGLTLFNTSGSSWIAAFGQTKTQSVGISTAPTTFVNTNGQDELGTGELASFDTNGGVSTSATHTVTITSGVWKTFVVEILDIAPGAAISNVADYISSSTNPAGVGNSGNSFVIPKTNPTGAGNCLVLDISYPHGTAPTISDNINGTWPAATNSADAGVGGYVAAQYLFPNAGAGQTTITVVFSAAVIPFNYALTEYYGVATSSPSGGVATSGGTPVTGPKLATGSFTPTNNNANGGNIIHTYVAISGAAGGNPNQFIPLTGDTLLSGDVSWSSTQGFPNAAQHLIQATSAAINPTILAMGDSADAFNCVAVALKLSPGAGTAPNAGRIGKVIHQTYQVASPAVWKVQAPVIGNLRVFQISLDSIVSIVTSDGSTFTKITNPSGGPPIYWCANQSANPNFWMVLTMTGSPTQSMRFFDIVGADASPFDTSATTNSTSVNGVGSLSDQPILTPTVATSGVAIACMELGQGPGFSVTSPTGAVWDLCTYATEVDTDLMENADCCAHAYYSTTTAMHFNWTFTVVATDSTGGSTAAAFKFAAAAAAPVAKIYETLQAVKRAAYW